MQSKKEYAAVISIARAPNERVDGEKELTFPWKSKKIELKTIKTQFISIRVKSTVI